MLKKEDAISIEYIDYGAIKNGKQRKQRVYLFKCQDCTKVIRCQHQYLIKHTGKCVKCSQRGDPFKAIYNELVKGANRRNHTVDLTFEEFLDFTKINTCHYCKDPIIWHPFTRDLNTSNMLTRKYQLDRKDNNIQYTKSNCVVCCTKCNYAKGARYTYDEWFGMTEYFRKKS